MGVLRKSLTVCLVVLFGTVPSWAAWPLGYGQRYVDAVNHSMGGGSPYFRPSEGDAVHNLTVITDSNPGLAWDGGDPSATGRVLMTAMTDFTGYTVAYVDNPYRKVVWVSAATELYDFHQRNGTPAGEAAMRTRQLLGLPANHRGDRVVELWVHRDNLRRPCKDPDITNPHSSFEFPADVDLRYPGHRTWFESNYSTYSADPPYPWTQLGYTYDWANEDSIVGLTEFLAMPYDAGDPHTALSVYSVVSIGSYVYYDRAGNFNVTGDCDAIWAGALYTPTSPGGNWIAVQPGATVYEGITVSSGGFTVTNAGSLLGPGRNVDNTFRPDVLRFEAGGRLVNTGTIEGRIGVLGAGGAVVLDNSGTISGSECAVRIGTGNDQVANRGLILGGIETGAGDDSVALGGGRVSGTVDGGADIDVLAFNAPAGAIAAVEGTVRNFETVEVRSGTARVNGVIEGSVATAAGARLGGVFALSGGLDNRGMLAPGNSIGTIAVGGDYRQRSGSTLEVELAKPLEASFHSDRLEVSGDVALEAGSQIEIRQITGGRSAFRSGDRFTVMTAGGTITDGGVAFTSGSDFLTFRRYPWDNTHVFRIVVDRTATFASAVVRANDLGVARALDADGDAATNEFAAVVNELLFMDAGGFSQAVEQLGAGPYHAVDAAAARIAHHSAESLSEYLRTRRHAKGDEPLDQETLRGQSPGVAELAVGKEASTFARPFGLFFGEIGYRAGTAGVCLGRDRWFRDDLLLGLSVAYAHTDLRLSDARGAGQLDNVRVGPYVMLLEGDWFFDGSVTYGWHDNELARNVEVGPLLGTPASRYDAHDMAIYLGAGRNWRIGDAVLSPTASLQYVYYRQAAFAERDGNGMELALPSNDARSMRSLLGARMVRPFAWRAIEILPEVFAGWAHEYLGDDGLAARFATATTVFSTDPGGVFRDSAYFGAGISLMRSDHAAAFFRYRGELAGHADFHACDLGVTLGF